MTDTDELIKRLDGYNTPDRTIDDQRQIAVDIQDAKFALESLQRKITQLEAERDTADEERIAAGKRIAELEAQLAAQPVGDMSPDQNWKGLTGSVAYHLIDRHCETWAEIDDAMNKWREANTAPDVPAVPDGMVLVPKEPSVGRLVSMAIRDDHGLGVAGYYDTLPIQFGPTHAQRLESAIRCMRQLYEEATGQGFYTADKEDHYASIAAAPKGMT